jgi:hypothetical protein
VRVVEAKVVPQNRELRKFVNYTVYLKDRQDASNLNSTELFYQA